jgi:hypothetical protein
MGFSHIAAMGYPIFARSTLELAVRNEDPDRQDGMRNVRIETVTFK